MNAKDAINVLFIYFVYVLCVFICLHSLETLLNNNFLSVHNLRFFIALIQVQQTIKWILYAHASKFCLFLSWRFYRKFWSIHYFEFLLKMKSFFKLPFTLVFFLFVVKAQEQQLIIEVLYLPTDCPIKSQNGDVLTTDYTGTLEDGTVFDSR